MEVHFAVTTLVLLVGLALIFDFLNGFHDAANSIATVVSTGVLKPYQAIVWAAVFNFLAIALFELKVAATVGKGIVSPEFVDSQVIFGALVGAISWNIITWYFGIPSSSSHALIGGLIGASMAKAGSVPLIAKGISKTAIFIVASPVLGLVLGGLIMIAVSWICFRSPQRMVDRLFRRLQLVSSALYSLGHGSNDAQKTMGVICVSTTHTITGAIIGVGAAQRVSAVRWGVAGNIVAAWILTIPASGLIAAAAWWVGGKWL